MTILAAIAVVYLLIGWFFMRFMRAKYAADGFTCGRGEELFLVLAWLPIVFSVFMWVIESWAIGGQQ